eukprot:15461062-Alexandrium_andersonii.AAC.1
MHFHLDVSSLFEGAEPPSRGSEALVGVVPAATPRKSLLATCQARRPAKQALSAQRQVQGMLHASCSAEDRRLVRRTPSGGDPKSTEVKRVATKG